MGSHPGVFRFSAAVVDAAGVVHVRIRIDRVGIVVDWAGTASHM